MKNHRRDWRTRRRDRQDNFNIERHSKFIRWKVCKIKIHNLKISSIFFSLSNLNPQKINKQNQSKIKGENEIEAIRHAGMTARQIYWTLIDK